MRIGRSLSPAYVAIEAEEAARKAADIVLSALIDSEVGAEATARAASDGILATAIEEEVAAEAIARAAADGALSTEIDTDVAAEATARALAIAAHAELAAIHHAVFTNTQHDVVARHPLANLAGAVCSETEAGTIGAGLIATHAEDDDIHHTPTALIGIESTPALFQVNPATGTFGNNPSRINDGSTAELATPTVEDQYAEVDFGLIVSIKRWRIYWSSGNSSSACKFKISYYNLATHAWVDWKTNIPSGTTDAWTTMATETEVLTHKVRITCTTFVYAGREMKEVEVIY